MSNAQVFIVQSDDALSGICVAVVDDAAELYEAVIACFTASPTARLTIRRIEYYPDVTEAIALP